MTVFADFRLDIRPYSGYDNPALPVGAWIAQGSLVGDASGGLAIMNFRIHADGDPQISELFNLEQIAFDTTGTASQAVILIARNMDSLAPNRPAFDQRWAFNTLPVAGVSFTALRLDRATILPIWLGGTNPNEGSADIRLEMNNVDGLFYLATLQGYLWGPRSVLAQGGPQRPPNGLFRG